LLEYRDLYGQLLVQKLAERFSEPEEGLVSLSPGRGGGNLLRNDRSHQVGANQVFHGLVGCRGLR
jgi:hypothetical protein